MGYRSKEIIVIVIAIIVLVGTPIFLAWEHNQESVKQRKLAYELCLANASDNGYDIADSLQICKKPS